MKLLSKKSNAFFIIITVFLINSIPQLLMASSTHIWSDKGFADFSKGETENLSLGSDGNLTLAPEVVEIIGEKSDTAIISLVASNTGVIYGGTSFQGRILIKEASGTTFKVLTETGELMVSALCLTTNRLYAGTAPNGILFEIDPKSGKILKKHDSGENYIWSIIQNSKKTQLLLGTGPDGKVLSFDGKSFKVLLDTTAKHILALAQHCNGFVAGSTSDDSMVLNLGADCTGPVRALFQPPQPECRSFDIDPESGTIYVCATTPPGGRIKQLVTSPATKSALPKSSESPAKKDDKDGGEDKDDDKDKGGDKNKDDDKDKNNGVIESHLINHEDSSSKTAADSSNGKDINKDLIEVNRNAAEASLNKNDNAPVSDTAKNDDDKEDEKDNGKLSTENEDQIRSFLARVKKNIAARTDELKSATGSVTEAKVPFSDGFGKSKQAVYAIDTSGNVRTVLASNDDVFFSVALFKNKIYCGSGNKGFIYEIDPATLRSKRLLKLNSEQVTTLVATKNALVAATSNEGRIYVIKTSQEKEGNYVSEIKQLPFSADFGTITWYLKNGDNSTIQAESRSGFTEKPDETWSPWSKARKLKNGTRSITNSPAARYFQYKLILNHPGKEAGKERDIPEVDMIEVCYQPHNLSPHIHAIVIQRPPVALRSSRNELSVIASKQPLQKVKGLKTYMRSVQWKLSDPNNDLLLSDIHLQLDGDSEWDKLMDEPTEGNAIVWETMSIPDGVYRLKITVDDSPSNLPQHVKSYERISEPFMVDNTPPRFRNIKVSQQGAELLIQADAFDESSRILNGEYSLNGNYFLPLSAEDGIFDHTWEKINHKVTLKDGVVARTIAVKLFDEFGNTAVKQVFVRNGKGSYKN
jgi:hypothetical protein